MSEGLTRSMARVTGLVTLGIVIGIAPASAGEPFVIAASPSMVAPIEAVARAFESRRPDVKVRIYVDSGLDLRRTVAAVENTPTGRYFIGTGPIHLIAPGGDELITRLEQKYYVLPGTRRPYAAVPLVMVVPESLVEAPISFDALAANPSLRVAVANPAMTTLGQQTQQFLTSLGLLESLGGEAGYWL